MDDEKMVQSRDSEQNMWKCALPRWHDYSHVKKGFYERFQSELS